MANPIKDLKGQVFGKLTVIEFSHSDGRAHWVCQCECGNKKVRSSSSLLCKKRPVRSCGCIVGKHNITHGLSGSKLYDVWRQMLRRCYDDSCKDYLNYGKRGIRVSSSWHDVSNFVAWAKQSGYRNGLTIERVDVNGNYKPSNCVWIKNKLQARNTRKVTRLTYKGETKPLLEWAEIFKVNPRTVKGRLSLGWSVEKALTVFPIKGRNQYG